MTATSSNSSSVSVDAPSTGARLPITPPLGSRRRRLRGQLRVARPLVPRAGVVPRVVPRGPQHLRREARAVAAVAVRDHLCALGEPDERAYLVRRAALQEAVERE